MKLTPEKLTAFCAALAETCNVGRACNAVGISRQTAYNWREANESFAAAWDSAMKIGVTALEDEAHRRAFDGVDDPLTHQGNFTPLFDYDARDPETGATPVLRDENGNPRYATVKKYSDTLAIFLLKAHAPDKYRENSKVELSGSLDITAMSEEDMRAELAALAASGVIAPPDDGSDLV